MIQVLTPSSTKDIKIVLEWIDNFICKSHAELARSGILCPFVPHLLQRGTLFMMFLYEIDGSRVETMKTFLRECKEKFLTDPSLRGETGMNKALLIAFPNIPAEKGSIVDVVHAQLKNEFVQHGLMLGEFHKNSSAPAARNPYFRASYAPLSLFVIRYMHLHDILFLREKESWFTAYYTRFGSLYERGCVSNREGLVDMFHEAKMRFISPQ